MEKWLFYLAVIAAVSSCAFSNAPDADSGFADAKSLTEFDGCYENCSDPAAGAIASCLSSTVWPGKFDKNTLPDEILVQARSNSELVVTAFRQGKQVKASVFIAGVDFTFEAGRIELAREYSASGAGEPGNVFIGVATGKTVLGLDREGAGRVAHSTSAAGTAFLIIPVAVSGTDVHTIRRTGAACAGD